MAVSVRVNNATKSVEDLKYKKADSIITEQQTQNRTRENSRKAGGPSEAGAVPNTNQPLAVTSSGTDQAENDETQQMNMYIAPGYRRENSRIPAGAVTPLGVSVRFPRSWLVAVAKATETAGKDPDAAALARVAEAEIAKIRKDVFTITGLADKDAIHVDSFFDLAAPTAVAAAQLTGTGGFTAAVGGNVKEIMLGGLALVSLVMMSMMVRKGGSSPAAAATTAAAVATAMRPSSLPAMLGSMEALVGEVSAQDPTLDGMELDDDAIKTQQMLSQVTSLVGENPESAAQLVKRWMNQR